MSEAGNQRRALLAAVVIEDRQRAPVIAVLLVICWALYLLASLGDRSDALQVPTLAIERSVPVVPWSIWVYLTHIFAVAAALWLDPVPRRRARTALGVLGMSLVAWPVFFFYPTTLPRSPVAFEGLTGLAWRLTRALDPPTNCIPSLHVALATFCGAALARSRRELRVFGLVWAASISASTLTTQQHVLLDVFAGLGLALLCELALGCWFADEVAAPGAGP